MADVRVRKASCAETEPLGPSCSFMSFDLIFAVFSEDLFTGFTGGLLLFPFV